MKFSSRLLSIVFCLGLSNAQAASFDCAKASSKIDNTICASPQVSQLDSDLDTAYKAVLSTNSEPDAVKTAQRQWLRSTRNQCQDNACLATVYKQRIDALNASLPKATQDAMADAESEDKADAAAVADVDTKKQVEDAAAMSKQKEEEAATLAKKQAEELAVKKKVADDEAALVKKKADDAAFWIGIKGISGLAFLIALIAYTVILRKRKSNGVVSSKQNDLDKSIGTILSESADQLREVSKDIHFKNPLSAVKINDLNEGYLVKIRNHLTTASKKRKTVYVIVAAVLAIIVMPTPNSMQGEHACKDAFWDEYGSAHDIKYDPSSSFDASYVHDDGSVSVQFQANLLIKSVGQPGAGQNLVQRMYNQANETGNEGWNIYRCESIKSSGGKYVVSSFRRVTRGEAEAFKAKAKGR